MPEFFYLIDNAIPICKLLLYSLSVLILITMSSPEEQPPFKMRGKYVVDIPTDGQKTVPFFPVVICNLIKEPTKKHSNEPPKTIRHCNRWPDNCTFSFSGHNLIEEPAETIRADETPKHSNQRPDDCTFFPVVI